MMASIRSYMKEQRELTKKLEATNEELNKKDILKNEFINLAAHELRAPMQPILGMAEILLLRKCGGEEISTSIKEDI